MSKNVSKKMKIVIISILSIMGLGLLSSVGVLLYIYSLSRELPSTSEISSFKYNEPLVVYDATGKVIAELGPERRYPVSMDIIPKYMGQAVVAVEDARFYEHSGVDFWGIARAFFVNLKAGRVVEGGSTLTQQLVKIIYLNPEKKLRRKIKEAILAYRIDNYLTKEQVLELYLNQINFGRGAYGVQAAAVNYFGKNVSDLTLAEAALFAGIPKAPAIYSPHINPEKAKARRNHVLYRMYEVGYITEDEYKKASEEDIVITATTPSRLRYAGYFIDYVQKYLAETLGMANLQAMQGLKVYTTLRIDYQMAAEKAVLDNLIETAKREGYYGPVGNLNSAEVAPTPAAVILEGEGDKSVVGTARNDSTNNVVKVPGYLENRGFKKAVVSDVQKEIVTIIIDNVTNITDNATGIMENVTNIVDNPAGAMNKITGSIHMKDSLWAKPYGSNLNKLLDFNTILKVNDIIYVSKDNSTEGAYFLEQDPQLESALISIDPVTGGIYAMVGGMSYEKSFFNRAVQAARQAGSTFKPIVYSAAFESGYVPMDIMLDIPVIAEEEEGEKIWKPKNYGNKFSGKLTIKDALLKSNNTVTIKLAEQIGVSKIIRYAKNFGFSSNIPKDLSVSLGSASSSVLEMAIAYSVFANGGNRPAEPYFVTKIEDAEGNILYEYTPKEPIKVLDEPASQMITATLIDTVERGSAWRAKAITRVVGAKTGTTNDSKDGWFAGFLPNMVTITWVGYDDFRKLGDYATGSSIAAPAWVIYMTSIINSIPFQMFPTSDKTAYFKVDKESKEITDAIVGDVTYEIYPVDDNGTPTRIRVGK